jgi:3-oxoacyl-[acyl-carrier protein] reductase
MGATGMLESFMGMPDTPENRARFVATIPMGRLAEPEDIAKAAVYFVADDSAFITGVLMPVDGGRTI